MNKKQSELKALKELYSKVVEVVRISEPVENRDDIMMENNYLYCKNNVIKHCNEILRIINKLMVKQTSLKYMNEATQRELKTVENPTNSTVETAKDNGDIQSSGEVKDLKNNKPTPAKIVKDDDGVVYYDCDSKHEYDIEKLEVTASIA